MRVFNREELRAEAERLFNKAKREKELTQKVLAERLGVNQSHISRAIRSSKKEERGQEGFIDLRIRIIEHLSGEKVRGPVWVQEGTRQKHDGR